MYLAKAIIFGSLLVTASLGYAQKAGIHQIMTHSHNDYQQAVPFFGAYQAKMNSIEADVFILKGELLVAHVTEQIDTSKTLNKGYLQPLYKLYKMNGNQPYAHDNRNLELVIDIKENYAQVIPVLVSQLQPYLDMVDPAISPKPVKIVLSGDLPPPADYKNYPAYLSFDGRPGIAYTPEELHRVAMISDELQTYTKWDGKGKLLKADRLKLLSVVNGAHEMKKPFRFWGTLDNDHTWKELKLLGVDWIGTDHPEMLHSFLEPQN